MFVLVVMGLLILHGPDGREITINPESITSMFKPAKGGLGHEQANCIVNLTDGKFVSVTEKCADIEKSIKEMGK